MNKKQLQKALVCTLASAMLVGGGAVVTQQIVVGNNVIVNAATVTKGDYIYSELSDGGVRFLGYAPTTYDSKTDKEIVHTPKSTTMTIPSSINGKPVREIGVLQNVDDYKDTCKKIVIPNTVKTIKSKAFTDWDNVTTLEFSGTFANNVSIEANAFTGLKISSVTLPAKTVSIGANAFADCDNLQTVTVKNTASLTVASKAFADMSGLKTVTFGTGGVKVGERAFADCGNLGTVTFGDSDKVVTIGKDAFRDSSISKVVFSKGTTSIGEGAFADCGNLKTANLSNLTSLKSVPANAFYSTKLSTINIPANILTIGANAFAEIESEADDYGDTSPISISFATPSNTKLKIDKSAFEGTHLTSVTVPKLAYNTTEGTISALTFEYANKLTVTNATQRVTNLDDTSIKNVVAPYGSYIWAGVYKASVEDNSSNALSFVTLKGSNVETIYGYSSSKGNIGFSAIKVTEGSNFTVAYDSKIALTDKGAKNVVLTAKLGYANITLKNTTQYNRFFVFTDKKSDSYNGSFKLTNKTDSKGKLTSFLQLTSDITKKYTAQAEKFADGVLTFDYDKDTKSGIYNKTYKTYVSSKDDSEIKPTVIITLNGKVVPSKYYTLKYSDNIGITGKAAVTATLNSEGSKIYSSGSIKKSFPVKRNIAKVAIYATDTIANGKSEKATNRLYDDAYKSAFLPVSDKNFKIGEGCYRANLNISGANKSVTKGSTSFTVNYDSESCFAEYNGTDITGVALGEVTCTLKAPASSIYFFGECDVRYFTRYNVSNLNSVEMVYGEDICTVKSQKDTAGQQMLYAKAYTYKAAEYKPKLNISQGGSQSEPIEQNHLSYSYKNNVNVSVDGSKAKLASVTATIKTADCTYLYGSKTVYFKIDKKAITDGMFNYTKVYSYTAGAITPTVKGKYNGVDLAQGDSKNNKDFTVSYSNNTLAGTGKITVKGHGNYSGSLNLNFVINKISLTNEKCKVTYYSSSNNTVSYRFGLDIKPNISLWYNGKAFSASDDYTVTYIGEKVNGKYTGSAPYLSDKTGYIVITPKSSSKKLYSVSNDSALKTYSYGSGDSVKTVRGVLFSYKTEALTLDHLHLNFNPTVEANDLDTMRKSVAPRILINGQVLVPYNPYTLRNEMTAAIIKNNPKKTAAECRMIANNRIPLTAKNSNNKSAKVRAYYGYYNSTKTNFTIVGILVNNTDKVNSGYWDLRDDFFIQNTREKDSGRWLIGTLCYSTEAMETTNSYKGLKLQSKTTTSGGRTTTSWIVKPGLHHIYTMNTYITGYTTGIDKSKTWDFNIAPSKSSITITDYNIEKVPGTASISFAPSVSDKYDGKTYYTLRFYKTVDDAKNSKNVASSVVLKYSKNKASVTTTGFSLVSFANKADKYTYTMKGLDYGRSYFVTVTATDSENEVSSSCSAATAFMTSTTIGTIDTISYTQNGVNFNAVAKIKQPSNKLNESGNIAHIYYVMKIYTNGGTLLKTYNIDQNNTSGYKQISKSDNMTVELGAIPGMKASEEYYATLETYLAYNTGVFTNTTYPVKCTYYQVPNSTVIYPMPNRTYKLTNTNKFSSSITVDKTRVNAGQPITITASTGQTGTKKGAAPYTYKYEILNSSGSLVGTAVTRSGISTLSNTYKYTPTSTGDYSVKVTITDKNNITSTSVQQFKVLTALSNASTLSDTEVPINKGVTINLGRSGGDTSSSVKYTVKLSKPDGSTSTLISDSTQSSFAIDSSKNNIEGKYTATVTVTDATGNAVSKGLVYTVSNSFINTSKVMNTAPYVNAPFEVSLSSAGVTSNVSYTVSYAKYDTSKKTYGAFTTCEDINKTKLSGVTYPGAVAESKSIKISSTGKYKIRITAKNGNSTKTTDTIINVAYADLVNESEVQSEVITTADTLVLRAASFGGVGTVSYKASYARSDDINNMKQITLDKSGKGTLVGSSVKNGTLSAGNYIIKVTATDAKGTEVNKDIYVTVKALSTFYKKAPTLTGAATTLNYGDSIVLGTKLYLTGNPAANVTAIYEYKQAKNTEYNKMTVDSNGVAGMTPQNATDYNIRVTYITADGLTLTRTWLIHVGNGSDLRKSVALYDGSTKLGNNPSIKLDKSIKIVIDKTSKCSLTCQFKNANSSKWYDMKLASDGKTATGTPSATGTYQIRIQYTMGSKVYYELVTFKVVDN